MFHDLIPSSHILHQRVARRDDAVVNVGIDRVPRIAMDFLIQIAATTISGSDMNIRQRMQETRWRHMQKVFALARVNGRRLRKVKLNHPASGSVGLADDDIAKSDVHTLLRSGDAAPNSHQEPNSDLRKGGKQTRCCGGSKRDDDGVAFSHPGPVVRVCVARVPREAMLLIVTPIEQSSRCRTFDGKRRDAPKRVEIGTISKPVCFVVI
ncbi:hypothetical protein EDB81DRAFT_861320 [Dactylonectria macrodidyma]|uniref:Uncharacterized protein n=1 Tax=Dactylonectria macrodidyma TaxID=307937 RepID=A0A9P9DRD7_9HYPO|nr:hypothetical protein EDB81DRAFT_861320 [Dactylonectria macrodidyma]